MKSASHVLSYVLHPLFTPFAGTVLYFAVSPKYTPLATQSANILPIFILTVIIPIITFFILKNMGLVKTVFLEDLSERKYPLYIHTTLLLMLLYKVIPNNYIEELYYYFIGLLLATLTSLLLLFFKVKASLHLAGISGILTYAYSLSVHFQTRLLVLISLLIIFTGALFSARLFLKAHTKQELVVGLLIGLCSQLLILHYWL